MAFELPLTDKTAALAPNSIRVEPKLSIQASFPIGAVLEVSSGTGPNGEKGILLQGQFFPATLPQNITQGQNFLVKVIDNNELLLLKILNQPAQGPSAEIRLALGQLLEQILPKEQVEQLKLAALPLKQELPHNLIVRPETRSHDQISNLIEQIIRGSVSIGGQELQKPKNLEQVLLNLGQNQILKTIAEAKTTLEQISQKEISTPQFRFLKALEQQIEQLLQNSDALSFEPQLDTQGTTVSHHIKLYTAISQYALETGNMRVLNSLTRNATEFQQRNSPLMLLLQNLTGLSFYEPAKPSNAEKALFDFMNSFVKELNQFKDAKVGDREIREALNKALKLIKEKYPDSTADGKTPETLHAGLNLLKVFENLLGTQEVLNQLNPLVHSLGEPALVLIPFLTQGFLAKWEMSVDPPKVDEDDAADGKNSKDNYARVHLALSLPSLGDVEVDLAYSKSEFLLNLTFADQDISDFVSSQLESLEKVVKEHGFEKLQLRALQGQPKSVAPAWYQELTRHTIIA